MEPKKYSISEQGGELTISYRWMACQAYFLVFFCLVWDGFLVVWYSIAGNEGDLMMLLFPIIHVAVGIGLTYYTICLFINRTNIQVSREEISISFAPLPWKGAKTVAIRDIVQFYVKEKVSSGKNGPNYSYSLWMRDKAGNDKKFASGPAISSSEDAKFLEKKIEKFLGLQDYQVDGEYASSGKTRAELPREQNVELNPINITLKNLEKGFVLNYDLKSWEVVYQAQYDWSNGQSDRLFRLIPEEGGNMLLFVHHEMGIVNPWVESRLEGGSQAAFSKLDPETAPDELRFEDQIYTKQSFLTGKMFSSDNNQSVNLKQWFYAGPTKSLRIIQYEGGTVAVFTGKKSEEYEFTNILPA